jgi:hypothetical protein
MVPLSCCCALHVGKLLTSKGGGVHRVGFIMFQLTMEKKVYRVLNKNFHKF